jgi:hypothetical protein
MPWRSAARRSSTSTPEGQGQTGGPCLALDHRGAGLPAAMPVGASSRRVPFSIERWCPRYPDLMPTGAYEGIAGRRWTSVMQAGARAGLPVECDPAIRGGSRIGVPVDQRRPAGPSRPWDARRGIASGWRRRVGPSDGADFGNMPGRASWAGHMSAGPRRARRAVETAPAESMRSFARGALPAGPIR